MTPEEFNRLIAEYRRRCEKLPSKPLRTEESPLSTERHSPEWWREQYEKATR